jgi:hypothetical protein
VAKATTVTKPTDPVPVTVRWTRFTADSYETVLTHTEALARFGDTDPAVIAGLLSSSLRHAPYLAEWEDSADPQVVQLSADQQVAVQATAPVLLTRNGEVWVQRGSWPGDARTPERAGPFADKESAISWCFLTAHEAPPARPAGSDA